jgi:hypothetical protein
MDWLLRAALERRQQDVIEARGRDLTTDACDSGGYARRRGATRHAAARIIRVKPASPMPPSSYRRPQQIPLFTWAAA